VRALPLALSVASSAFARVLAGTEDGCPKSVSSPGRRERAAGETVGGAGVASAFGAFDERFFDGGEDDLDGAAFDGGSDFDETDGAFVFDIGRADFDFAPSFDGRSTSVASALNAGESTWVSAESSVSCLSIVSPFLLMAPRDARVSRVRTVPPGASTLTTRDT
jgi:hypothetical protein